MKELSPTTTMRTYMKAKDVHRHMRQLLAPWFSAHGWIKRAGYSCAFEQNTRILWLQPSQWGDSWSGSSLTLNLTEAPSGQLSAGRRVLRDLDVDSREVGFALEELVISRIPAPAPDHFIRKFMAVPGADGDLARRSFDNAFKPNREDWGPDQDIWLRYFAADDLDEWAMFLLPRLESLLR